MSPFNCFSSTSHVEILPRHSHAPHTTHAAPGPPYDQSSLPQMRPSPPRSPSRRISTGRRSFDGVGRDRQAFKGKIGAPTGLKHVGHVGGDGAFGEEGGLAASLAALTSAPNSPRAGLSEGRGMRTSLSAPSSSPSSPILSARTHAPASASARAASPSPLSLASKHASLPPPSSPFTDASNRSPSAHLSTASPERSKPPRPISHQPSGGAVKRKAPPPVTASVIRAVPGGVNEAEKSGPVPTLARRAVLGQAGGARAGEGIATGSGSGSGVLALQELFSPSEIKAIEEYQRYEGEGGAKKKVEDEKQEEEQGSKVEEGTQTKIFKGAMADIEAALRQAA